MKRNSYSRLDGGEGGGGWLGGGWLGGGGEGGGGEGGGGEGEGGGGEGGAGHLSIWAATPAKSKLRPLVMQHPTV